MQNDFWKVTRTRCWGTIRGLFKYGPGNPPVPPKGHAFGVLPRNRDRL